MSVTYYDVELEVDSRRVASGMVERVRVEGSFTSMNSVRRFLEAMDKPKITRMTRRTLVPLQAHDVAEDIAEYFN